jgi:hypothetical protein
MMILIIIMKISILSDFSVTKLFIIKFFHKNHHSLFKLHNVLREEIIF